MEGFLYCLVNDAMPGYVKIGMTTRSVQERMAELYTTGVPVPFRCVACKRVQAVESVEARVHKVLADYRVPYREFFRVDVDKVITLFGLLAGETWEEGVGPGMERKEPVRQGKSWTYEEQDTLLRHAVAQTPYVEIAQKLERTEGGVKARLRYIACNLVLDGKSYQEASDRTGLDIPIIEEAMKLRRQNKGSWKKK